MEVLGLVSEMRWPSTSVLDLMFLSNGNVKEYSVFVIEENRVLEHNSELSFDIERVPKNIKTLITSI